MKKSVVTLLEKIISLAILGQQHTVCYGGNVLMCKFPLTGHGTVFEHNESGYILSHKFDLPSDTTKMYRLAISAKGNRRITGLFLRDLLNNYSISEFDISEEDLFLVLNQMLKEMKTFVIEHGKFNPSAEAMQNIEALCGMDGAILLHGTNKDVIPSILENGLNVWDLGLSCRTTAMAVHDSKMVMGYDYASYDMYPRNVIIFIPRLETATENFENHPESMTKCLDCPLNKKEGYDGWCYEENFMYERVLELKDGKWVIPARFIYGVSDYNGKLVLNEGFDPVVGDCSKNMDILRRRILNK